MVDLDTLNRNFGIPGVVEFAVGAHGAPIATLSNRHGTATVAIQGAQVLTWAPAGQAPVVWLSPASRFASGKSLRGGAPVCWPWFGAHPDGSAKPAHGFARNLDWEVRETTHGDDATRIVLGFAPGAEQQALWPYRAELTLVVDLGQELRLELITRNTDTRPIVLTQALHTYFGVGDIGAVRVEGLSGCVYIDKVDNNRQPRQIGPVTIGAEVDRIYLDCPGDACIVDEALGRRIRVSKQGSNSYVVWNPWIEKCAKFGDMAEDAYRRMLCLETVNAGTDIVTVAPGASFTLGTAYSVEAL
ncbi:MAG TPA: D-hexose-6-phosphate mutarotase [Methylococcaceae bacterium]|nr:D-hexose-6-phosphate mutarotase [Methylococcaceae bacterium]